MLNNDKKLSVLFAQVNKKYFDNELKLKGVLWAYQLTITSRKKRLWACCLPDHKIIQLDRVLRCQAPNYVLAYLIYHECLHLTWAYHCRSFNQAEKKFQQYKKADQWLERHEHLLMTE